MSKRIRNLLALIINCFLAISTIIIVINGVKAGASAGQVGNDMIGIGYFKPYTIDTNVLNGLAALAMAIVNIYNLIRNKDELPRFLVVLQFISAVGVMVTMMTVVAFLSPIQFLNYGSFIHLFSGDMFFFHLLNPILSIVNFIVFDRRYSLNKKEVFLGMSTTVIYSFVYAYFVMIKKTWPDFYGFTFGGKIYMAVISIIVMYLVTLLFSFTLSTANRGRELSVRDK